MKKIFIILIIPAVIIGGLIYFLRNPAKTSSGQPQSPEASVAGKTYDVAVANFFFSPAVLDIEKGDKVVWTNQDSAPHTISGSGFKSNTLNNGQSFSFTFGTAGSYDYICGLHPYMKGRIIIK